MDHFMRNLLNEAERQHWRFDDGSYWQIIPEDGSDGDPLFYSTIMQEGPANKLCGVLFGLGLADSCIVIRCRDAEPTVMQMPILKRTMSIHMPIDAINSCLVRAAA